MSRTLQDLVVSSRRRLADHNIPTPELDARVIVMRSLGLSHGELIARAHRPVSPDKDAEVRELIARRLTGEPVSRLFQTREFYGRDFAINRFVLDPRPETEILIDQALTRAGELGRDGSKLRILDLGCGSGAIIVTLLAELSRAAGVGTDICPQALRIARTNATRHGVTGRAHFAAMSWGAGLKRMADGFDLIVANPPYIATAAIDGLAREVRLHDPLISLDGGADGLACYRLMSQDIARLLSSRGYFLCETGADQPRAVATIFARAGLGPARKDPMPARDLAGLERVVTLRHRQQDG